MKVPCLAAILTNNEREVLLQLRDDKPGLAFAGHWTLPGGRVEPGEDATEAIECEIFEELGIRPALSHWKVYERPHLLDAHTQVLVVQHVYLGRIDECLEDFATNEGQAVRYYSCANLGQLSIGFGFEVLLEEYFMGQPRVDRDGTMSPMTRRVQAAYDHIAPVFAERNAAMPRSYVELGARFAEEIGTDKRILDLGCGVGRDMAWFEQQGLEVVGVDLSVEMLRLARTTVRGRLVQLDMRRLPFGPGVFHGVWCSASLLHIPKAEAPTVLSEARRVLAPNGVLFLALQEGEGETWERGVYRDEERFFARYSVDEVGALISEAGFDTLEQRAGERGPRRWLDFLARLTAQVGGPLGRNRASS